jgi:hypothetical protein
VCYYDCFIKRHLVVLFNFWSSFVTFDCIKKGFRENKFLFLQFLFAELFDLHTFNHRCKKGWNAGTMFPEIIWACRNFRKSIIVFQTLLIYFIYAEELFRDKTKISQTFFIFKIISGIFRLFFDLEIPYSWIFGWNFLLVSLRSQTVKHFLHPCIQHWNLYGKLYAVNFNN